MVITEVDIGSNIPSQTFSDKLGFFRFDYESETIVEIPESSEYVLHAEPYRRFVNCIYVGINPTYGNLNIEARVLSDDPGIIAKVIIRQPSDQNIVDPYSFESVPRNNTYRLDNVSAGVLVPVYVMLECNGYNISTDDLLIEIMDVA